MRSPCRRLLSSHAGGSQSDAAAALRQLVQSESTQTSSSSLSLNEPPRVPDAACFALHEEAVLCDENYEMGHREVRPVW